MKFAASVLTLALSACVQSPERIVPVPTDVNLENAIMQVRNGLVAAQNQSEKDKKYSGFYPCSATIVFNITAKADKSNTLVMDASVALPAPISPKIGVSDSYVNTAEATRGNQITVNLVSSICLPSQSSEKQAKSKPLALPREMDTHVRPEMFKTPPATQW